MSGDALQGTLAEMLRQIFEQHVPFNRLLGLKVSSTDPDSPRLRFDMRADLIGNPVRGILHGGVISSVLDVTGGMIIIVELMKQAGGAARNPDGTPEFPNIGTVDLRVDYLRPGRGKWFEASGKVVRTGSRIAVAHMQLENDRGELIATGSGAYVIG